MKEIYVLSHNHGDDGCTCYSTDALVAFESRKRAFQWWDKFEEFILTFNKEEPDFSEELWVERIKFWQDYPKPLEIFEFVSEHSFPNIDDYELSVLKVI